MNRLEVKRRQLYDSKNESMDPIIFSGSADRNKDVIEVLVKAMTPHSFRARLVSNLERRDMPRPIIKKLGRWSSERSMEQYIRDGLTQKICRL